MERLKLSQLVSLAKMLAKDTTMYRPGMTIQYMLNSSDHEILQRELYEYQFKSSAGFKSTSNFEFDIMDVTFKIGLAG